MKNFLALLLSLFFMLSGVSIRAETASLTGREAESSKKNEANAKVLTGNAKIYKELMDRYGNAVVRVKYVMSANYGGSESRQEIETSAVLVGEDGLILVADAMINPRSMISAQSSPAMEMPDIKSDEFRVRMADDDNDHAAEIVTHDSDLGLAWIKLKTPPKDLVWVDLNKRVELEIGQSYYGLSRTSADFGNVVIGSHGTIVGKTDTPIRAMLASGPLDLAYSADGKVVGFVALRFTRDVMSNMRGGIGPQTMIYADKLANATDMARTTFGKLNRN